MPATTWKAHSDAPHVVVVGGGFAGLECVRALRRAPVRITLVDRTNHHLFQPLLYQVATAALSPGDIASALRGILRRQANVRVWLADVRDVDVEARRVAFDDGELDADFLVVATGATHSYFGNHNWERHAPGLKTLDDAVEIRRRFLEAFEAAEREADPEARRRRLTFVVVGGGPTGVELAGTMAEIARRSIPRDFRAIDTRTARVVLVEALDRVLPPYPERLSEAARRQLEELGVEVLTGRPVSDITADAVTLEGGERIEASNVFWGAGVEASGLGKALGAPTDSAGRVRVEPDLSLRGHPNVFVAGDLAHVEQDDEPVPGIAPAAIQMGRHVARTIRRELAGKPREPFRYGDKGIMATIGRARAVARIGRAQFSGLPAWLAWVFVHVAFLVGFRNRLIVMTEWAWSWLTWQRGVRLITGRSTPSLDRPRRSSSGTRPDDDETAR